MTSSQLRLTRRTLLALPACLLGAASARADGYPARPIRLIVQFPPGGNVDTFARALALEMSRILGQQLIVDNRAGGNGSIAYQALARAPADGYTLGIGHLAQLVLNPHLLDKVPYRPLDDFKPIARLADAPNVLAVHPSLKVGTLAGLLQRARAEPGVIPMGHGGVGTVAHLAGVLLEQIANVKFLQVPYKGSSQSTTDLIAGQIQASFGGLPTLLPHIQAGRLRAIGVTSAQRLSSLPDIPTMAQAGVRMQPVVAWMGLLAPAGTPAGTASVLEAAAIRAMHSSEVLKLLDPQGFTPMPASGADFARFIRGEDESWKRLIHDRGLKAEQA
jgi:tripartite-type tricarboxylate transporter receptor subunit TctC